MVGIENYRDEIVEYRQWLESTRASACKHFLRRLTSNNSDKIEQAVAEAVGWCWLGSRSKQMDLVEDSQTGGIDFRCVTETGAFYAEVTTLGSNKVFQKTGLSAQPTEQSKHYSTASGAIKYLVMNKASQPHPTDAPYVVFVVSLHFEFNAILVSTWHMSELLLGRQVLQADYCSEAGCAVGSVESRSTLDHPLFFESHSLVPARQNISAVLVGGFGGARESSSVLGLLNQNAIRMLDQRLLPDVCFGKIMPWPVSQNSNVEWARANGSPCDDDTEMEVAQRKAERRLRAAGHGEFLDEIREAVDRQKLDGAKLDLASNCFL